MLVQIKEITRLREVLLSGFLSGSTLEHESVAEPSAEVAFLVKRDPASSLPRPAALNAPSLSEIEVMLRNLQPTPQVSHKQKVLVTPEVIQPLARHQTRGGEFIPPE